MEEPSSAPAAEADVATSAIYQDAVTSFSDLIKGDLTAGASSLVVKVVLPAAVGLLLLIVTYFIARLLARWVSALVCHRVDQTLGRFSGKLTFYAVMLVCGLTILQTANVGVTGFAAVIAAAGFAIGLAFQGTLSNFAAGVLLLVFRPFRVGDMISAAGVLGKVYEIDLFTTALDTPDNRRLIIPNSSISGATIENITYHKHRRVDVPVGVAYAADIEQTRRVLVACAESLGDRIIRGEGRGYQVLLTNLGASSVEWTVRVWANTVDFFAVKELLTATIKRELDAHGLEIPFPQMQVHWREAGPRSALPEAATSNLPMPKLAIAADEALRAPRVRPRARGESV